jgi:hypothetical protein
VKLRVGVADLARGKVSLTQLFALYKQYRSRRKSATGQKSDERRIQMCGRACLAATKTLTPYPWASGRG